MTDIEKPAPTADEVLIRIHAASINAPDWRMMGAPLGRKIAGRLRKGQEIRPGTDVAAVVESVGPNATRFKAGDAVFGSCRGSLAEYGCVSETKLLAKPESISFEHAACIAASGITALQALRDHAQLRSGQQVLINGASGAVGTFAVQVARALGGEVTAVCSSGNVDQAKSLGATRVFDYTREDVTKDGQQYDAIIDNVGTLSLADVKRMLTPSGHYVLVGGPHSAPKVLARLVRFFIASRFDRRIIFFIARLKIEDLAVLRDWMQAGKVTAVIDRVYSLAHADDALRYAAEGHSRAKVVITVRA